MKTTSFFKIAFVLFLLIQTKNIDAQNGQINLNTPPSQGVIRDEIIFLEGTSLPNNGTQQTALNTINTINSQPVFYIFNTSLIALTKKIEAKNGHQQESKSLISSMKWFRLPTADNTIQEGYSLRVVEKWTNNLVVNFGLGKANKGVKVYVDNATTTVSYDETHHTAYLSVKGKVVAQVELEKEKFMLFFPPLNLPVYDVFVKKADGL